MSDSPFREEVIVIDLNGRKPAVKMIEGQAEDSKFKPRQKGKYLLLTSEKGGLLFTLSVIKRLVEARCEFTVWELGEAGDVCRTDGATQVW